ncbi:ribonuclease H1 small subunit [Glonium stellatum]|uniref:Ribonuclease H1 small subunit n=1 Tax=Glonium stellatum TaxID=574774 RepID=A0A8E2FCC2_9PEZI|nr:ribonuclease H1 small subunit [Glonium stellatum]
MLAIQQSDSKSAKCALNLIPCHLNHDGPVNATERYWNPEPDTDGTHTAYFRGRKLKGKNVKIPDGYRGAVLNITDKAAPQPSSQEKNSPNDNEEGEEDDEKPVEVKLAEELGSFDEIMVWSHESMPSDTDDPYLKGVQEWMSFAKAMHCSDEENPNTSSKIT